MQCFKCHINLFERKSEYGFYYFCPNCGKIFETKGQQSYNSKKYNSRSDYMKTNDFVEPDKNKLINSKDIKK